MDILRGLPEGSRLSPTLFSICVAELILELRAKFRLLQFPLITSIDDLNWIGAFLYVDDMVLIARSPSQLQSMIDACQDWAERSLPGSQGAAVARACTVKRGATIADLASEFLARMSGSAGAVCWPPAP